MTMRSSGMLGGREGCSFSSATPKAICKRGSRGAGDGNGRGRAQVEWNQHGISVAHIEAGMMRKMAGCAFLSATP
jgi:hypothetical protein